MKLITIKRVAIAALTATIAVTVATFVKHLINHHSGRAEEQECESDETSNITS